MSKLTAADMTTIRRALSYAIIEREGFVDATKESPQDKSAHDRAIKMVKSFEALHRKLFDEPSAHQQQKDDDAATPSINIFDLGK